MGVGVEMKKNPVEIEIDEYGNYEDVKVTFGIDPQALIEIDNFIDAGIYKSRSHFFRDAAYFHIGTVKNQKLNKPATLC